MLAIDIYVTEMIDRCIRNVFKMTSSLSVHESPDKQNVKFKKDERLLLVFQQLKKTVHM